MEMPEKLSQLKEHILKALLTPPPADEGDPLHVLREAYLNAKAYKDISGTSKNVDADDKIRDMVGRLVELRFIGALASRGQAFIQDDIDEIMATPSPPPHGRRAPTTASLSYVAFSAAVALSQSAILKDGTDTIHALGVQPIRYDTVLATSTPLIALIDKHIAALGFGVTKESAPDSAIISAIHDGMTGSHCAVHR